MRDDPHMEADSLQARIQNLERQLAERTAALDAATREAQVEAALERVRARSMAMHTSGELIDIVQVVQDQLIALGLPVLTSAFDLIDQEADTVTHWTTDWTWKGVSHRLDGAALPLDKEGLRKKLGLYKDEKGAKNCTPSYLPEFIRIEVAKREG